MEDFDKKLINNVTQVHLGKGDNVGGSKVIQKKISLSEKKFFSMNNPIIWLIFSLIVVIITMILKKWGAI